MAEDNQAIEQVEADRRNHENVECSNVRSVISQEGLLRLRWWPAVSRFGHVIGDGRLRDLNAELEQLAMDPRRAPKGIGLAHLADQVSKFFRDPRPAAPGARFPPPESSEPLAMPSDDRFWVHQRHRIQGVRDDPIDPHHPPTVPA